MERRSFLKFMWLSPAAALAAPVSPPAPTPKGDCPVCGTLILLTDVEQHTVFPWFTTRGLKINPD